jgi:hypothetical protein
MAHWRPAEYLTGMSPPATARTYDPATQVVFDQLAATYLLFAFNEAVVLRRTRERSVWRAVVLGIALCDLLHLYGACCAMGARMFGDPRLWRGVDWVNLGLPWGPVGLRMAFLLEVGFGAEGGGEGGKREL